MTGPRIHVQVTAGGSGLMVEGDTGTRHRRYRAGLHPVIYRAMVAGWVMTALDQVEPGLVELEPVTRTLMGWPGSYRAGPAPANGIDVWHLGHGDITGQVGQGRTYHGLLLYTGVRKGNIRGLAMKSSDRPWPADAAGQLATVAGIYLESLLEDPELPAGPKRPLIEAWEALATRTGMP